MATYTTKNSFDSDSMLSDMNGMHRKSQSSRRKKIKQPQQPVLESYHNQNFYESSEDITAEIDRLYTPQPYMVRTSTARDTYTPRNNNASSRLHNRSRNSQGSSDVSYDTIKQDMNKLFEQNRRNHQQAIITNNKLIQNKLRLQTAINKTEAKFIEKSLIMDSESIKGMNSKELGK